MAEPTQEELLKARQEREEKERRKTELVCALTSPTSEYGDYKAIKCVTAYVLKVMTEEQGKELPYDLKALEEKRQAMRDEIDTLRKELGEETN